MKIFITFSGAQTNAVAVALKNWLENIFNGIKIFVSSESLRKGKRWRSDISSELQQSQFGIACLTRDTMDARWILFESGALTKQVQESALYTVLFGGLRPTDVNGPLADFNHTVFEKEDVFKLLKSINESHGDSKWEEARLKKLFDNSWADLEAKVTRTLKTKSISKETRSPDEMLQEVLEIVRQLAKTIPQQNESLSQLLV